MVKEQTLLSHFRRAVNDYNLISDNDKIAVGLSGGKDSVTLLKLLKSYQRFSPQKFDMIAINIDLGFLETSKEEILALKDFCESLEVEMLTVESQIAEIIFEARKETNPCSLCAKMRRGALCSKVSELGFNKLALGHHSDDLIETFFMSMFYEGRLSTFMPKSYMDRSKITLIRPMIYISESEIKSFSKNLPIVFNPCPVNHHTSREYMKNMIKSIEKDIPFVRDRMFKAITSPDRYNLFDKGD